MTADRETRGPWRAAGLLALAALGFAATTAAVRALVPWPEDYGLRAKMDWFEERRADFDVLFLGSSRVFRSVDPRVVDEELARAGLDWHSANLAVGGMSANEADFVLRHVLARAGPRLKWVVLEGRAWEPDAYFLGNTYSTRSVGWHDLEGTRRALRAVWVAEKPLVDRVRSTWRHVELAGLKLLNVGQGERIVANLLGTSRDPLRRSLSAAELDAARGFQALDALANDEFLAWRRTMLAHPERFDERIANVRSWNQNGLDREHYDLESTRAQQRDAAARGAGLLVLLPPGSEGNPAILRLHEQGDIPAILDFNDPDRFPQFFRLEMRFDEQHLNAEGARELSRLIGRGLAERAREAGQR